MTMPTLPLLIEYKNRPAAELTFWFETEPELNPMEGLLTPFELVSCPLKDEGFRIADQSMPS
jgi:hypothetical protein